MTLKRSYSWDHKVLPIVWAFTCDFPAQLKFEVREGFSFWDEKVETNLFFEYFECLETEDGWAGREGTITVTHEYAHRESNKTSWGTAFRDVDPDDFETIRAVKIKFWTPWLIGHALGQQIVARHEVGHALGLHHVDYVDCLMFKHSSTLSLCDVEKEEFMRLYGKKVIVDKE